MRNSRLAPRISHNDKKDFFMTRADRIAILLSLLGFAAAAFVSQRIYEGLPHIEDEMAYVWQAKVITRGAITVPSPVCPECFLVPFVVDHNGLRFGKYPLGWPVVLSFGELTHTRWLINPILNGLTVWLLYRLGKKLLDERTALLSAALFVISPFVLLNAGSLLSSTWALFLSVTFTFAWLDAFTAPNPMLPEAARRSLPAATAGLALGALALTRPLTALAIALPFAFHGLYLLVRGDGLTGKRVLAVGLLAGAIAALYFLWQYAVTGDPLLNPYTLWWPYDRIGFGRGIGLQQGGFAPIYAYANTRFSLFVAANDLFGWPRLSWLFIPFGLLATRRNGRLWLVVAMTFTLVGAYTLYWITSWVYGPRYYYEALAGPILLTAAGIRWLGGAASHQPTLRWKVLARLASILRARWMARTRFALVSLVVIALVAGNLLYYLPRRIGAMKGDSGISRDCYRPFETSQARDAIPALVFVYFEHRYNDYGCLLDLNNPFLDSDFVLAIGENPNKDFIVAHAFQNRKVLYYYPDTQQIYDLPR
jgi:hypothetical protein